MRRACIDIGSNTTRLLVAECEPGRLAPVHAERAFTRIGRGVGRDGTIDPAKIAEVVSVAATQLRRARQLGVRDVRVIATAGVRDAPNRAAVADALAATCGLELRVLSEAEEARLAFAGAAWTLEDRPDGTLGVVDVGGGSSELVVGTPPDDVAWYRSLRVGSGGLADRWLRSDPPSNEELRAARADVERALNGVEVPVPSAAYAVGGTATSLQRLAGPILAPDTIARLLDLLASTRASEIARRLELHPERVRLMPGALLILAAATERFGSVLAVAHGGLREGVLLEASR